jgi:hypothetical protein
MSLQIIFVLSALIRRLSLFGEQAFLCGLCLRSVKDSRETDVWAKSTGNVIRDGGVR